jgi:uncharacterized protein (DUF58 family)
MLTPRGRWFLLAGLVLLSGAALGQFLADIVSWQEPIILRNTSQAAMLAVALLLWFGWEWFQFAYRARLMVGQLEVVREVGDQRGPVQALWCGRTFRVRVTVRAPEGVRFPYLVLEDRLPYGAELARGTPQIEGGLEAGGAVSLEYSVRVAAAGRVRFEGLRVRLADLQGFFYRSTFVPAVAVYRVLPPIVGTRGQRATLKRQNLLLPPGYHRHRRPGSGSELLDLRDYLPGDPPKTIAWKVSARRDRLITKEFESEVPVRCTLFVDTSNSVRLGAPGENALAELVRIGAAVAQSTVRSRDLTGLCLFDDTAAHIVRPARGRRHLAHLLNLLTDAAGLPATTGLAPVEGLIPLAHAFAGQVYPEMLRPSANRVPFWLPWLVPPPPYVLRNPRWRDRFYRWLPWLLPLYAVAAITVCVGGVLAVLLSLDTLDVPAALAWGILAALGLALPFLVVRAPGLWLFPARRRLYRWRKQLAALLSVRHGLAPGGLEILLENDEACSLHVQRFLAEHHVPFSLPLYDPRGRYLFAAPGKVTVLADALTRAVGKEHDNELFVLLADLLELTDALAPLLRAVKVALGRHHRVLVVCPWPPEIPVPDSRALGEDGAGAPVDEDVEAALKRTTRARYHRAFHDIRRTFGRLGVLVVCARTGDSPRLILERLELLRGLGSRP